MTPLYLFSSTTNRLLGLLSLIVTFFHNVIRLLASWKSLYHATLVLQMHMCAVGFIACGLNLCCIQANIRKLQADCHRVMVTLSWCNNHISYCWQHPAVTEWWSLWAGAAIIYPTVDSSLMTRWLQMIHVVTTEHQKYPMWQSPVELNSQSPL